MEPAGTHSRESICVIGAGPAGLVTAKTLRAYGFEVTVFEKFDEIGGTWSSHRRYADLQHQQSPGGFEFSDLRHEGGFHTAERTQAYLAEYAREFDLIDLIEFETEVVGLEERADGWTVETTTPDGEGTERHEFGYVAVCSGLFHFPKTPEFPGQQRFAGEIRHSSAVSDRELLEDRQVVVVGGGKSGTELATYAAEYGDDARLVCRSINWFLPKKLIRGLVPHQYLMYSRVGSSILPRYHDNDCVRLLDRLPERVKAGIWRLLEHDIQRTAGYHRVEADLTPETTLPHDGVPGLGIIPDGFIDRIEAGDLTVHRSGVERIDPGRVVLQSGERIEADIVVLATGYHQDVPFADTVPITDADGRVALYKGIVPPDTEGIGFVGLQHQFANLLLMEVSAHWLARYFRGDLPELPSATEMRKRVRERLAWQSETMPGSRGYDFGPYVFHRVDELMLDMGLSANRSANPVEEYLLPGAMPRRYQGLAGEWPTDQESRREETPGSVLGVVDRVRSFIRP